MATFTPRNRTRIPGLRLLLCALLCAGAGSSAILGCAAPNPSGIYYAQGEGSSTADGLRRIKWGAFQATFLRPGVRMEDYQGLIIEPLVISYQKDPVPGRIGERNFATYISKDPNYPLPEGSRNSMQNLYEDFLREQLIGDGRFEEAEKPGKGVLRLRGHIASLVIATPPVVGQPPDGTSVQSSAGHMVFVVEMANSETGEAVIRMGDARQIRGHYEYFLAEGLFQSGALRMIFGEWADDLRRQIDTLSALPQIPIPEG